MKILWEKWNDPLKRTLDEEKKRNLYDDNYRPDRDFGPSLVTPMGVIPFHEENCPSKVFNLWRGDCDFTFTKGMRRLVANLPGVESIDVQSKYRFRVGIGRAFDENTVKNLIEETLCRQPEDETYPAMQSAYFSHFPFWALVRVNNRSEFIQGESAEEVRQKIPSDATIMKVSHEDCQSCH